MKRTKPQTETQSGSWTRSLAAAGSLAAALCACDTGPGPTLDLEPSQQPSDGPHPGSTLFTEVDGVPAAESIGVDDFPAAANPDLKAAMVAMIGDGHNHRLAEFYTEENDPTPEAADGSKRPLSDVYADFGIDPAEIMMCDARHQQALDINFSTWMKDRARHYFCLPLPADHRCHTDPKLSCEGLDFDTVECRGDEGAGVPSQERQVYRGYCLDESDSLDWIALQSMLLNASDTGTTAVIPADRSFHINQVLVLPSDTRAVWQASGDTYNNGRSWIREGASFITLTQDPMQLEPIENHRSLGFSTGSTVIAANMPAVYSGKVAIQSRVTNGDADVAENIELFYPHIDAGGLKGENGFGFAQAVQDVSIWGGVVRNVRINAEYKSDPTYYGVAPAGGKAVQCEAGCRRIELHGINIHDSHIGINSNVIRRHEQFKPWVGRTSDIVAAGVYMEHVDIPINALNDFHIDDKEGAARPKAGSQRCHMSNFYINNSGRMSDEVYAQRHDGPRPAAVQYSDRVTGFVGDGPGEVGPGNRQYPPDSSQERRSSNSGLVMSLGGYFVQVSDGLYFNPPNAYGGIDSILSGWGEVPSSYVEDIEYRLELDCSVNEPLYGPLPGC